MTDRHNAPEAKERAEKTTLQCNRCGWESELERHTSDHPCPEPDCDGWAEYTLDK